ncbi:uncharacterized protein [Medicago truncatula]|uniref:uncharacterized protein n=1 Tax=Medicago truncatula TaxID=3880 RepID=UPI0019681000|nr:uncharacterized protein LOC25488215 [Medicago truncatula]
MSNKLFFSQNLVLGVITTKSTTLKFNNHFSFPFSLKCSSITTSQSESITQPFAVSYLINNFDFSTESALKAFNLRQVRFNTPDNPDSVINFFQNHGFSHSDIRIIIKKAPWLLSSQPHKRFLKTNKDTIVYLILNSRSFITPLHLLEANINLMVDFGVCDSAIARLLRTRKSIYCSNDLIKSLEDVKGLGFDPSTAAFGTALVTKHCMSNILWDKKVDVFKKWGWSDEDVIRVFRCQPSLMLASIDKINLVMSFWVNQMGWDPLELTKSPLMFGYSLPKRIIPRASVLQFILMKGLRKKNASLGRPFSYSENMFLNKCVFSFKEESDYLLKLYDEKMKLANTTENNGMPSTKCSLYFNPWTIVIEEGEDMESGSKGKNFLGKTR